MNYDKIDLLLRDSGARFEFLHGVDYDDFCPYKFSKLIINECISCFDGTKEIKTVGLLTHTQVIEMIKKNFGINND